MTVLTTPEQRLAAELSSFYADPLGHVMFSYPWNTEPSIQVVRLPEKYRARFDCEWGPDRWACEFLDELGEEVRKRGFDGKTPVPPIYFATVSGHEIGKTTLVAWIIKWIMDTRRNAKGSVTAVTDDQLRTKTWAELGKWHYMSPTRDWFTFTASRGNMSLARATDEESGTWRVDARTCREEKSESFAGQHSPTSTSFYIFDEASGVPDKVYEVREGGLSSGEPMVFDFGNGTRNTGRFFENCMGRFADQYIVRSIDSRTVAITNKEKIQTDIDTYGEDSDFVRVRWRGLFPSAGSTQFIPTDLVLEAGRRDLPPRTGLESLTIGVDVARFGDDKSVIWPKIGKDARSFAPQVLGGDADTVQLVRCVIDWINRFRSLGQEVGAIFVDGGGVGGGVVDMLRHIGHPVVDVQFGGKPSKPLVYRYLVDELWGRMRDALNSGLCIPGRSEPEGEEIYEELTQRQFGVTAGGALIRLEEKRLMKERLRSPDRADALAVNFLFDVPPRRGLDAVGESGVQSRYSWDYDPQNWGAFRH